MFEVFSVYSASYPFAAMIGGLGHCVCGEIPWFWLLRLTSHARFLPCFPVT